MLPAHAGMVPADRRAPTDLAGAPRARGDGPMSGQARQNMAACSPRTRGWSLHVDAARRPAAVLPAHAGMVPSGRTTSRPAGSAPRARGDGPSNAQRRRLAERCSPRTRGWSLDRYYRKDFRRVLPAHAGMVPRSRTRRGPCRSAPRARGDGPVTKPWQCGEGGCSPRTRGWSLREPLIGPHVLVLPRIAAPVDPRGRILHHRPDHRDVRNEPLPRNLRQQLPPGRGL